MAAPCACNGWLDGVPLPPKTDCPRCHGSGNLPASADEAADQLVARHGGAGAIRKLAETIEGINDEPGDVLLQEGRAIVALVEAQIWRSVTETITWLRKWADALQNYGTEVRAQVDGEVVWWMRKAADLLEAEAAPNLVALDNQELDLILSWYTYSPYDDDPGDDLAEKLKGGTAMVTSDFLFDPAERRMSSRLVSLCPRCGAEVEDLDGFGVLIHDACGFCSHPDAYGGKCRSCEAVV